MEEIKTKLASKAISWREAKGWEYWKKRNPNLSEEELEEKVEQYVDRHPETKQVINKLLNSSHNTNYTKK